MFKNISLEIIVHIMVTISVVLAIISIILSVQKMKQGKPGLVNIVRSVVSILICAYAEIVTATQNGKPGLAVAIVIAATVILLVCYAYAPRLNKKSPVKNAIASATPQTGRGDVQDYAVRTHNIQVRDLIDAVSVNGKLIAWNENLSYEQIADILTRLAKMLSSDVGPMHRVSELAAEEHDLLRPVSDRQWACSQATMRVLSKINQNTPPDIALQHFVSALHEIADCMDNLSCGRDHELLRKVSVNEAPLYQALLLNFYTRFHWFFDTDADRGGKC